MYRTIISIVLLLTYSLGFAHNVIPHSHNHVAEKIVAAHDDNGHQHHQHLSTGEEHDDHKHISHNNHYDESLLDLMVCFINEIDHSTEHCKDHHYLPAKSNTISLKNVDKVKLTAVLFALIANFEPSNALITHKTHISKLYLIPLTGDISHRGPPSIS